MKNISYKDFSDMVDKGEKLVIIKKYVYDIKEIVSKDRIHTNNVLEKAVQEKTDQWKHIKHHASFVIKIINRYRIGKIIYQ